MKIGILETGEIPENLLDKHGSYPSMFARLLKEAKPDVETFSVAVCNGEIPAAPDQADGWIITGSRHGVYEDLPWIAPLKHFLQQCLQDRVPVAGICFGHQLLAEALGGKVEKSPKGWGIGVQEYRSAAAPAWMKDSDTGFAGRAVHQDQITAQPPNSTILASSNFCEYAALAYGDPEHPLAISVQPHPEFSADYVDDLIGGRLASALSPELAAAARKSLDTPVDNAKWGNWIIRFFEAAIADKAS